MVECPSAELLDAIARGDDDSAVEWAEHLRQCDDCRNRLDDLRRTPDEVDPPQQPSWDNPTVLFDTTPSGHGGAGVATPIHELSEPLGEFGTQHFPIALGDYELLEVIGEGGMGVVYRARQKELDRIVAVKMCRPLRSGKASPLTRFRIEAESAARLDHPGIVPIIDVGEVGPYVFFVMGYVSGGTLAERVVDGPLDCTEAATHVQAVAEAIAYAHERGVIHRDMKSANILLDAEGRPKVADFGLAKRLESDAFVTTTGEILGTPSFMPPEQAGGQLKDITTVSDIYGLGAILYHLVTGRPPFTGDDPVSVLFQVIHNEPVEPRQLNPLVPRDLETIILKCLAKSPDQRYDTAGEVADELGRFLAGEPISARPLGRLGRLHRWCRRNPVLAGMTALVACTLVVATAVSLHFGIQSEQTAKRLAESNDSLLIAERNARTAAETAGELAEIAQARADAAMNVLETMLYELQSMLSYDPAAQENRRRLLKIALNHSASKKHLDDDFNMPELPEVETMVRGIRSAVEGCRLTGVERCACDCKPCLVEPSETEISRRAVGRRVERVYRVAKRAVIELDSGDAFVIEPRMTGLMLLSDPPSQEHLRMEWRLSGPRGRKRCLWFWDRRGLGTIRLLTADEMQTRVHDALGPDALTMTFEQWRKVCGASQRDIKVLMLDQAQVAGIGNLYASEILHLARIHPEKPAATLSRPRVHRIAEAVPAILNEAIRYEGSTLSDGTYRNALNQTGQYQNEHRVYQRAETTCTQCRRGRIRRIVQAQRSTFFCPVCQK